MRWSIPLAVVGALALAGCASAGGPTDTSAPAAPPSETASAPPTLEPTPSDGATADPQPTAIPQQPERITDEAILNGYDAMEIPGDEPVVAWADDSYSTVHVIGAGSGTESCQPTGESIEIDDGQLEIDFEPADPTAACTADLRTFGWAFTLPIPGDESITMAQISDWMEDADDITVEIRPAVESN